MPPALFRRLSDTETPQGVMAVVRKELSEEEFSVLPPRGPAESGFQYHCTDRLQTPETSARPATADAAGFMA
jgi:hypothetical protein